MNQNITRIIEQYLQGELNEADKLDFEERLAKNENLQAEVALQKNIQEGVKRASQRVDIQNIAKKYHYSKLLKWGGASLGVVILIVGGILSLSPSKKDSNLGLDTSVSESIRANIPDAKLIDNLTTQLFSIPKEGTIVLSKEGILISAPKGAFLENGKIYNGEAILKLQEALDATSIVKSGLSTMSGDRLLETQGMFSFEAFTPNGERLDVNPEVGVYMQIPVEEYKEGMQLFDGVKLADGSIDWQNPEPLAKIPVSAKMSELDFFPVGYEKHLDVIKWSKSKKKRDSLYLSFEENSSYSIETEKEYDGMRLFESKCTTCHMIDKDGTGPKLRNVRQKWEHAGNPKEAIITWVQDFEKAMKLYQYARKVASYSPVASNKFPDLSAEQITSIFDYIDGTPYDSELSSLDDLNGLTDSTNTIETEGVFQAKDKAMLAPKYILPSSVLAFWKSKFNNTNLATRDFEKRMRAIHSTCSNAVLRKYTKQLSKPISQIDKEVVAMGYSTFEQFALENVGAVNPNNPHLKALEDFYQKGIAALKDKAKRNARKEQKRRNKWDKKVNKSRTEETTRKYKRESEALLEEFDFNMRNVKKQIGKTVGLTIYHSPQGTIKNIDAYVWEATVNRTSMDMIDPISSKRVKVTYNDFSIEFPNADKYIKLYAYLFPHQLNSYQRISRTNGKFDYPLNDDIIYDIGIVGITEDGYEYFQKQTFNGGELGTIEMKKVTEKQLDASIKQLNGKRISKPMRIKDEMDWLFLERKDYLEQKQRKNMRQFRREVMTILFPCYSASQPSTENIQEIVKEENNPSK